MAKMLDIEEVCVEVGVSRMTIENWYRYKRENPTDSLAKILPDYYKEHEKSRRLWKKNDIKKLLKFKEIRRIGRNGQMSKSLQKYVKKEKKDERKNDRTEDAN